ncbi:MAG: hypothetical protein M0C28_43540 [Candidatus Moduliflexus flocculans]|nr:hypothetical protein [Candidatus Moduliflexus flocculans]
MAGPGPAFLPPGPRGGAGPDGSLICGGPYDAARAAAAYQSGNVSELTAAVLGKRDRAHGRPGELPEDPSARLAFLERALRTVLPGSESGRLLAGYPLHHRHGPGLFRPQAGSSVRAGHPQRPVYASPEERIQGFRLVFTTPVGGSSRQSPWTKAPRMYPGSSSGFGGPGFRLRPGPGRGLEGAGCPPTTSGGAESAAWADSGAGWRASSACRAAT